MKLKTLMFMLTSLLLVLFIAPLNGEVIKHDYERVDDELEDHPWGGDEPDPGGDDGGISNRVIPWATPNFGASYFVIDVIKIVLYSNLNDPGTNNTDLLPDSYGQTNFTDQKGQ